MFSSRRSQAAQTAVLLFTLLGSSFAIGVGACGGRVIIDQPGAGGAGGVGGTTTNASSNTTVVNASAGSFTDSASVGDPPPPCVTCAEYANSGKQGVLCPESEKIYNTLSFCVCASQCIPQCSDNACSNKDPSGDCDGCIQKLCGNELAQCLNDI